MRLGSDVAIAFIVRMHPRAERIVVRLGNVLTEVSGEIHVPRWRTPSDQETPAESVDVPSDISVEATWVGSTVPSRAATSD